MMSPRIVGTRVSQTWLIVSDDDAVDVRRDPVHAAVLASFARRIASMTSWSVAVPISAPDSSVTTQRPLGLDSAELSRSRSGSPRRAEVAAEVDVAVL